MSDCDKCQWRKIIKLAIDDKLKSLSKKVMKKYKYSDCGLYIDKDGIYLLGIKKGQRVRKYKDRAEIEYITLNVYDEKMNYKGCVTDKTHKKYKELLEEANNE